MIWIVQIADCRILDYVETVFFKACNHFLKLVILHSTSLAGLQCVAWMWIALIWKSWVVNIVPTWPHYAYAPIKLFTKEPNLKYGLYRYSTFRWRCANCFKFHRITFWCIICMQGRLWTIHCVQKLFHLSGLLKFEGLYAYVV